MKKICYIILIGVLSGCASKPLLDKNDVKLTRDEPASSCQSLGPLLVTSISIKPDEKKMMDELKEEARKKGSNFVKVQSLGSLGTSIRGEAFNCP